MSLEKPKQKARPRWLVVSGVLALILVICVVTATGVYFWLGLHRSNQLAEIVPADSVAFASISPSLLQLPQLRQTDKLVDNAVALAPLAALPGVVEVIASMNEELPLDLEIDVVSDVLPWIGREVSLAILNSDQQVGVKGNRLYRPNDQRDVAYSGPPIILATVTRNQSRSDAFLADLRNQMEREGIVFIDSNYSDIQIAEITSPSDVPLAYATFNGLVVLATDVNTLREAIDKSNSDGLPVLDDETAFQDTLDRLPVNRLGYVYLNVPPLVAGTPEELIPWQLETIKQAGIAFALTDKGVRFDYVLHYEGSALAPTQEALLRLPTSANELVNGAPVNSLVYFSGQNLSLVWESLVDGDTEGTIRVIENETGMDLIDVDLIDGLLALTSGEYAGAVVEDSESYGEGEGIALGLLLLANVEDSRPVEQELEALLRAAGERGGVNFYEDEINQTPMWMLEARTNAITYGYGFAGDLLFMGTSREVLNLATQATRSSLADSELFQTAVGPLPDKNHGFLYLDVEQSLRLVERALDDVEGFDEQIPPYLRSVRAVSMAAEPMDGNSVQHGVVFVVTSE